MGKSAIVTGASRGIGRATALALARNGYDLLVCYQSRAEDAASVCADIAPLGVRAIPFAGDIGQPADCRRIAAKALMEFGAIDVLVNNAGIALPRLFLQTDEAALSRVMRVNFEGMFFLSQAVAREMIAAGGGAIVNVASMWGLVGASGEVAYSASKAAVVGFTKALAKELAPSHIRVNGVAPGVIDTEMNACYDGQTLAALAARTPLGRLGTPEEVAEAIAFLAGDESAFMTGQILTVDGGFAG